MRAGFRTSGFRVSGLLGLARVRHIFPSGCLCQYRASSGCPFLQQGADDLNGSADLKHPWDHTHPYPEAPITEVCLPWHLKSASSTDTDIGLVN